MVLPVVRASDEDVRLPFIPAVATPQVAVSNPYESVCPGMVAKVRRPAASNV